jgi:CO/xanthine dehydrogenase Mo-binding subunit
VASAATDAARELSDRYGKPVRVVFSREDVVRHGPKRPPVAAGLRLDETGVLRVVASPGVAAAIQRVAPGIEVAEFSGVPGPPVSPSIRAAGWAEAAVLLAAGRALAAGRVPPTGAADRSSGRPEAPLGRADPRDAPALDRFAGSAVVHSPGGARAEARVTVDATGRPVGVEVAVSCGDPLDETVLRSYIIGAAHMGLGWVCSEGIAVDDDGVPEDLTIRSFGILRARDTPAITVRIEPGGDGEAAVPVRGSDAAFAAVAAAAWIAQGLPPRWPTRRGSIT